MVTALNADDFGAWEEKEFAPESDFLAKVRARPARYHPRAVTRSPRECSAQVKGIDGISVIETQTYTLMPVD